MVDEYLQVNTFFDFCFGIDWCVVNSGVGGMESSLAGIPCTCLDSSGQGEQIAV
jgi:hypothetical protein